MMKLIDISPKSTGLDLYFFNGVNIHVVKNALREDCEGNENALP
ncbi:hypothetical protein FHR85_001384 [Alkalibacillus almallahensis]|nr:hypothetical protein [Alkalibacillus almallahensis]